MSPLGTAVERLSSGVHPATAMPPKAASGVAVSTLLLEILLPNQVRRRLGAACASSVPIISPSAVP